MKYVVSHSGSVLLSINVGPGEYWDGWPFTGSSRMRTS